MQQLVWSKKLFQARAWISHWLEAVNEHSLHAPFVYDLYRQVIKPAKGEIDAIESLRADLRQSDKQIEMVELGAGSSISRSNIRKVSSIARHSLTPPPFSALLYRLAQYTESQNILELGTSLGLNTLYLAAAAPQGTIHTLEGCPATASLAAKHFQKLQADNIALHVGNIDRLLPELLQKQLPSVDLAYLDANHTHEATLRYFEWLHPHLHDQSIVVVDDIHWSAGMQEAWEILRRHPSVSLSLDLYEAGLLFIRPGLKAQHYVLEY